MVTKVEDFLTCDDPWFRPVDIQQGPDGALYVADFYNCIIGHYEVPLTHPKRDRERGRIWRVVYKGEAGAPPLAKVAAMPDLQTQNAEQAFALLQHPNLTVRVLATNYLVDKFPKESEKIASELLSRSLSRTSQNDDATQVARADQACHAIWVLQRTGTISESVARRLLGADVPASVQVHAVKAIGETSDWQTWQFVLVRSMLENGDAFVRRAAAEALSKHPSVENLSPLLTSLQAASKADAQLYHGIRIALRDQLRSPAVADTLLTLKLSPKQRRQLVEFAATAPTGPAAILVFDEALRGKVSDELLIKALPAAARYVDVARADAMAENVQARFAKNTGQQISLLRACGRLDAAWPAGDGRPAVEINRIDSDCAQQ